MTRQEIINVMREKVEGLAKYRHDGKAGLRRSGYYVDCIRDEVEHMLFDELYEHHYDGKYEYTTDDVDKMMNEIFS